MSNAAKLIQDQKNLLPINSPVPNRRILIVDDEPSISDGMKRILVPHEIKTLASSRSSRQSKINEVKKEEFDVVVVNTPQAALMEVKKSLDERKPFAMGFFDVMLGADIDGIELVKQLLTLDPRLFAVFVTAYHDRNVDAIGSYLGEQNRERWDYINKPFTDGEILQKARNATSLWDLHRLKEWQADRLSAAHQLLLQTEKQTAAAAIGRSVAHEFGNLLTHIIGHAEIALDQKEMPAMISAMNVILKASDTATTVLRRFRKLNDTYDASVEFKKLDLLSVLDEALELMEFRFRRHLIIVDKTATQSMSAQINRNALIQVFVNLFINGMHAMPDGGQLTLSLKQENEKAVLRIKDSGKGIPEEILPRVTEPLFTTKGKDGSGLGLAICKEIIEIEHNGIFSIENHAQGGVIVTLTIPLTQEDEE